MNNPKPFVAPVWCIPVLILCNAGFAALDVYVLKYELSVSPHFNDQSFQNVVHNVIVQESWQSLFLLTQAVVYWCIRRRSVSKQLAWLHVGMLAVAYMLLQAVMFWFTQMRLMGQVEGDTMYMLVRASRWLSRITIVVAEVFFVMMLIKLFRSQKAGVSAAKTVDPDPVSAYVSAAAVSSDTSTRVFSRHTRNVAATDRQKEFVAPVWFLGILLMIVTYMLETMVIFWYQIGHEERFQGIDPTLVLPDVFRLLTMAVILLAECFFYYHFRHHMRQKWPAWTHLALLFAGWMLFPAVFYLSRPNMSRDTGMLILNSVKWTCTIVAHVYFFIALKRASRDSKEATMFKVAGH